MNERLLREWVGEVVEVIQGRLSVRGVLRKETSGYAIYRSGFIGGFAAFTADEVRKVSLMESWPVIFLEG